MVALSVCVLKSIDGSLFIHLKVREHQELFHELCHPDYVGNVKIEESDSFIDKHRRYRR